MSRFGGAPKCPVCDKSVYFAEEVVAEGKKFHKACFKCSQCNKMLDRYKLIIIFHTEFYTTIQCSCSSTATAHEGTLYCHPCHRRNFGLKGYGYGQGAGVLATDSGGKQVPNHSYATTVHWYFHIWAYVLIEECGCWVLSTFVLSLCYWSLHVGTDSWNPPAPTSGRGAGGSGSSRFGGADKCPRCGRTVYMAEKIVGAGSVRNNQRFNSLFQFVSVNLYYCSLGTRDALTALHVVRNWTPLLCVTKMERSTANVSYM